MPKSSLKRTRLTCPFIPSDDSQSRKAELYLESLEKIDDDCDVAGINFVKVDDAKVAAKEYGLEELPRLVLFKNKLPHVFEGG